MSIRPDSWIREMAEKHGMIEPFEPGQVKERDILGYEGSDGKTRFQRADTCDREKVVSKERVISYGTSSYGYDLRTAAEFKVFTPTHSTVVDPKKLDERAFVDVSQDVKGQGFCLIPPNSFALCRSVERFKIPDDVLGIVLGKSSYARCGIVVNVTPLEPGWEGYVTIEISNTTPLPAKVYANEGIAQCIFLQGDPCETTYADRSGKYMNQPNKIVLSKM